MILQMKVNVESGGFGTVFWKLQRILPCDKIYLSLFLFSIYRLLRTIYATKHSREMCKISCLTNRIRSLIVELEVSGQQKELWYFNTDSGRIAEFCYEQIRLIPDLYCEAVLIEIWFGNCKELLVLMFWLMVLKVMNEVFSLFSVELL